MALKLTNNATSLLASGIATDTTDIVITSGDEARFPTLGVGDWFPVTVVDGAGNLEIMKCTARAGVTLTVTRAQEGTTAKSFSAGARVDVRLTAAALMSFLDKATYDPDENGIIGLAQGGTGVNASDNADLRTKLGITQAIADAVAALVDSSPAALDTLNELAAALGDDANFATTMTEALAGKLAKSGGNLTGLLVTLASAAASAGLRLPHGAAPTAPVNGDIWTTTAGLLARINGATRRMITDGDVQSQATWNAGSGTSETLISPAKLAEAIGTLAPVQFYSGSLRDLTDYPIGTTILTTGPTADRNGSRSLCISTGGGGFVISSADDAGAALSGSWRAKGSVGSSILYQRVA